MVWPGCGGWIVVCSLRWKVSLRSIELSPTCHPYLSFIDTYGGSDPFGVFTLFIKSTWRPCFQSQCDLPRSSSDNHSDLLHFLFYLLHSSTNLEELLHYLWRWTSLAIMLWPPLLFSVNEIRISHFLVPVILFPSFNYPWTLCLILASCKYRSVSLEILMAYSSQKRYTSVNVQLHKIFCYETDWLICYE